LQSQRGHGLAKRQELVRRVAHHGHTDLALTTALVAKAPQIFVQHLAVCLGLTVRPVTRRHCCVMASRSARGFFALHTAW
jgi:hypothetical protein